jgi:hypothetical protein
MKNIVFKEFLGLTQRELSELNCARPFGLEQINRPIQRGW